MSKTIGLSETLAQFQRKRAETMAPDKLKISVDQRRHLVETANRSAWFGVGHPVAPFELEEADGEILSLDIGAVRGISHAAAA